MKPLHIILISVGAILFLGAALFGFPAYGRYQACQDAQNEVIISSTEIKNTEQHIEIEKRKAEVRVAEAQGIAESQRSLVVG